MNESENKYKENIQNDAKSEKGGKIQKREQWENIQNEVRSSIHVQKDKEVQNEVKTILKQ